MTDLIIWRHAQAAECSDPLHDAERPLTARGEKQAVRMAGWLDRQLPQGTRILVSPALRAAQTVAALARPARVCPERASGAALADLLTQVQPAKHKGHLLLVGHQPSLGRLAALLLSGSEADWSVKKGAVWWFSKRSREGRDQTVLRAVMNPEMLR